MVDERGTNVSGGFGQSIALARVFVRKSAGLIILDEATAAMDGYKKRQVRCGCDCSLGFLCTCM